MRKDLHEANRLSWNAATVAHNRHKRDQAEFFRRGGSTLFPEEIELLGDVRGKTVVHLQCNAGQDSLSVARLGAEVLGVDISDEAIGFATELAKASGIAARFIRTDLYEWLERTEEQFDLAFASYGALCWLSDLHTWARGVERILRPGGRLVCVEYHPMVMIFDPQWQPRYDYFGGAEPLVWESGISDYVGDSGAALAPSGFVGGDEPFANPHPSYEFQWTIADVVTAVLDAGLTLHSLREYPYANGWKGFEGMRELEGRRMVPPAHLPSLPLMFSLVGVKE